jgi:L-ascorbate metabolism protein UlaG (beta-lactamase superfamily)
VSVAREIVLDAEGPEPDLAAGSIYFVGTATVLIRVAGYTILTDPNFIHMHEEVDLGYGLRARRLTNPAIEIQDLPPIDLVVLSHFHGDHFDQVAESELDKHLPIVTPPQAAGELERRGFVNVYRIETWEAAVVRKGSARLRVTAMPGWHGPSVVGALLPEVMGSVLELESSADSARPLLSIYITGDTLVIDELKEIPRRYPDLDLALVHLGGTDALGVMVTMDGKQGVELLRIVQPRLAIPIHYNDYNVFKSPLSDFQREVETAGLADRVHYLSHGETYAFSLRRSAEG